MKSMLWKQKELASNLFVAALESCARIAEVDLEVRRNYSSNLWWPTSVTDWRVRMLVAGWSTRVSYAHISHYQRVVKKTSGLGWEGVKALDREQVTELVGSLGLADSRYRYLRSLSTFLRQFKSFESFCEAENQSLIEQLATEVDGAGFKVAQCAVLYAKGYHCGIIPIDSGLVEMLQPLVPVRVPSGAKAHEVVRIHLEDLVRANEAEVRRIAECVGFDLDLPPGSLPTWWVHLVFIYYKRIAWNKRVAIGPFRRPLEGGPVDPVEAPPAVQGKRTVQRIIIEGVDGAGKTTLATRLGEVGYESIHCPFSTDDDVIGRYLDLLDSAGDRFVLDRSFLSEWVYGRAKRGRSRISRDEVAMLVRTCHQRGIIILYLEEPLKTLLVRRPDEDPAEMRRVISEYRSLFASVSQGCCVYSLRSSLIASSFLPNLLGWNVETEVTSRQTKSQRRS